MHSVPNLALARPPLAVRRPRWRLTRVEASVVYAVFAARFEGVPTLRGAPPFARGGYAQRGPAPREAPALLGGPPLAGPPAQFSLSYDMVLDYRRRCRSVSRCVTALPLARIVELCNIGVRVLLTIRLVGGREAPRRWLSKVGSLTEVALSNLTELYIWGHEVASQKVLWCGAACLTWPASPTRRDFRAPS